MQIAQKWRGAPLIDSAEPLSRNSSDYTDNSDAHSNGLCSIDTNDLYDTTTDSHTRLIPLTASADAAMTRPLKF